MAKTRSQTSGRKLPPGFWKGSTSNRKYSKRSYGGKRIMSPYARIPQATQLMKQSPVVRHQYITTGRIAPFAAVGNVQQSTVLKINANQLYQSQLSNTTITGGYWTQNNSKFLPDGFATLQPYYNHYVVLGSKITLRINVDSDLYVEGNYNKQNFFALQLADESSGLAADTSVEDVARLPLTVTRVQDLGNSTRKQITLTGTYSPKKFFGLKDPEDASKMRCPNLPTGSVNDGALWKLFIRPLMDNPVTQKSTPAMTVSMCIDFIVKYQEMNVEEGVNQIAVGGVSTAV